MAPRPKHSTKEKAEENRQRILESAIDSFAQKGFDGANMREIARGADVNKYMLYYHFEDKQTLFEQVLSTITQPAFARLTRATGDAADLEEAVANVYDLYADLFTAHHGRLRSFLARELAAGAPRLGKVFKVKGPEIVRLWEPKITAYLAVDKLPYQDLVRTVITIMSTIVATFLTEPVFRNILEVYGLSPQDPAHREHVLRFILGGVRHRIGHVEPIKTEV